MSENWEVKREAGEGSESAVISSKLYVIEYRTCCRVRVGKSTSQGVEDRAPPERSKEMESDLQARGICPFISSFHWLGIVGLKRRWEPKT